MLFTMQRTYLAIDLRGYPSDFYEKVCRVVPAPEGEHPLEGLWGVEVESPFQLKSLPKAPLVFARGGSVQKNRKFLSSARVDVLSRPYPFDSVQARLSAENNIAVELCFAEIRNTYGYVRAKILNNFQNTVKLARKYHSPLLITSGASCEEEVVSPRQLVAFGKVLGLDYPEAKASIYTIPKSVVEGYE